ncbi:hypothetical protein FHS29_004020 [Saccharothrix tamanrassetensis]|uniref:Uncharacterized protein n=1 Tax=Saccharothrix tamanrassetensis TaxID=1051531 RepID=A0A841CN57_9PSEU|nr:hypothetical protein [Saccharothrix tamanrassetensis]MBB5957425.1 hypothetical protein [Saccharothrix tamanrassetensis]
MNEPVRNAHALLRLSYHQFELVDRGMDGTSPPTLDAAHANGLVAAQRGAAVVLASIHTGYVDLSVDLHDHAPEPDTAPWDDVVEISLDAPHGEVRAAGLMSNPPQGLPVLTHAGPGTYRVRVHVRGRDTAVDQVATDPVEFYRLSLWPAPAAPTVIHKQTDHYGATLRARALSHPLTHDTPETVLPIRSDHD